MTLLFLPGPNPHGPLQLLRGALRKLLEYGIAKGEPAVVLDDPQRPKLLVGMGDGIGPKFLTVRAEDVDGLSEVLGQQGGLPPPEYITETELATALTGALVPYQKTNEALGLGTTAAHAFRGDQGQAAYTHAQATGNPHATTITDIPGLQDALTAASGTGSIQPIPHVLVDLNEASLGSVTLASQSWAQAAANTTYYTKCATITLTPKKAGNKFKITGYGQANRASAGYTWVMAISANDVRLGNYHATSNNYVTTNSITRLYTAPSTDPVTFCVIGSKIDDGTAVTLTTEIVVEEFDPAYALVTT